MLRGWRPAVVGFALVLTAIAVIAIVLAGHPGSPGPAPSPGTRPAPSRELQPVPDTRPRAVVALGDSLAAGEGAGAYAPGTRGAQGNFCHRSAHAVVQQVTLPGVSKHINLACSGADSADVRRQAARLHRVALRYRVRAVLVTVGANDDPQFAATMLRCIEAWARPSQPPCSATLAEHWSDRLADMIPKVVAALGDVRTAMRTAGYARTDYSLVLTSYPSPLTTGIAPELQDLSGCPFRTADLRWIDTTAVDQLSAALRRAAHRAGARFLDLSHAAEGHEACSHADAPRREWINRLTVDFGLLRRQDSGLHAVAESFHPNATGYAKIAGCVTEFLRSRARQASCVEGPGGQLHPVQLDGSGSRPVTRATPRARGAGGSAAAHRPG